MDAKKMKDLSVFIALILRHKPEAAGITLDEHGWADVKGLIDGINGTGNYSVDRDILDEIVRTDNKQRYSFNEDKTKIRANQGHSVNVDVELKEAVPPEILYHGTAERNIPSINEKGLIHGSRLYVHLSKDTDTALTVGKRHGKPCVYKVSAEKMHRDGHIFYLSKNGVWLTKAVPPGYLEECTDILS